MNKEDRERNDEIKDAMKEALKEWLDEKFTYFGKWSMGALGAALLAGVIWFILHTSGWHK